MSIHQGVSQRLLETIAQYISALGDVLLVEDGRSVDKGFERGKIEHGEGMPPDLGREVFETTEIMA
jgi:hypothetical protein